MTTYDFVQLAFYARNGKIKGKTKVQKIVYFLAVAMQCEEELGYRPHFYGPYSSEVADAVERLKTLGFLDQTIAGMGTHDDRGFEIARYDYKFNEAGQKSAEAKSRQFPAQWEQIQQGAKAMDVLFKQNYMELSIAAKTWFMLRNEKEPATQAELAALAPKFGWDVKPEEISKAAQRLQEAGLLKIAA